MMADHKLYLNEPGVQSRAQALRKSASALPNFFLPNFFLLLLLGYAGWHQALTITASIDIKILRLTNIPMTGLANCLIVAMTALCLGPTLCRSYYHKLPDWIELLVAGWPLLHLLQLNRFDNPGLVYLENSIMISILIAALCRRRELKQNFALFHSLGLLVFTLSYSAAIFLPLFMSNTAVHTFERYGTVYRYQGWTNAPTIIGYAGLALSGWGAASICSDFNQSGLRRVLPAIYAMALGLIGIHLSVLRIALPAAAAMFLVAMRLQVRTESRTASRILGFFALISLLSLFSPAMRAKNQPTSPVTGPFIVSSAKGSTNINNLFTWFESHINTNGRLRLAGLLLEQGFNRSILGLGTGAGSRYLFDSNNSSSQPHCELLRIFVDHGMFGLTYFLILAAALAYRLRKTFALSLLCCFGIAMLTDNVMVYPAFFYGPLFLAGMLTMCPNIVAPHAIKN